MRIWVILWAAAVAIAQTPPAQQAKSIVGEVTSVDAGAKQLAVKTDTGTSYSVKIQGNTTFLRMTPGEKDIKKATPISFADIEVGDRVAARGPVSEEDKSVPARSILVMTKTDLAKKHEQDREGWQRGVVGEVSAVNPDTKEITVTLRNASHKPITVDVSGNPTFLRYAPGSYKFDDAKPGTLADVKSGDTLRVRGERSDDGGRIKADEILSGSFFTLAGTVISVDPANGTVKVTDLVTKKPVEVKTTNDTLSRRLPEMMAAMMAHRTSGATAGPGAPPPTGQQGWHAGGPEGGHNFDLQQALERMPPMALTDLKPGEPVIVSSTKGSTAANVTAITLVAGVEPFLRSAPKRGGQADLGSWSFDGGIPTQ